MADALIQAGVDNSGKSLAATLVWENDCDVNLHSFEPNFQEISDYAGSSSSSGGEMDVDTSPTMDHGLNAEITPMEITRWVKKTFFQKNIKTFFV